MYLFELWFFLVIFPGVRLLDLAQMNLSIKQKQTHRHREEACGCQGGFRGGRGMDWDFGIGRCEVLHLEWINNKVLIYSTGNYIQYPVTNYNGKEYKQNVCMYITESLCWEAEVGTTLSVKQTSIKKNM